VILTEKSDITTGTGQRITQSRHIERKNMQIYVDNYASRVYSNPCQREMPLQNDVCIPRKRYRTIRM